jgi:UDP-N-acetylglucosamine 2-epimerase
MVALATFHFIKVAHVEAGLRTFGNRLASLKKSIVQDFVRITDISFYTKEASEIY